MTDLIKFDKHSSIFGWGKIKASEIGELLKGVTYKKEDATNAIINGYIPILRSNNIDGDLNYNDLVYVPKHYVEEKQFLRQGDIVFAMSSGSKHLVGKSAKAKFNYNGSYGAFCSVFRPINSIDKNYVALFFQSPKYKRLISEIAKGTNINNLKREHILDLEISLPPLPEQHRIVAKIEELFSELDKGVEALKTAQQQLKGYRQAVLNSAIAGDTSKTIEEVVVSLDQGWSPKCYNEPSGNHQEWGVIKTTAIQAGYFQEMENKRLPENLQPRTQHELKKGDLLITRAGPRVRVGICCLVKKVRPHLLNCDKVYRIRINTKIAIPEYIAILLNSPKYSREIEKMKTGISDSGVNLTQKGLLKIVISLPSIEQQTKIVQEIETRLSVADKLEETIAQSLQQAEALRQSILKKAFAGKLVPQDPSDEPASKLLERIKAEKAVQLPVKRIGKRKGELRAEYKRSDFPNGLVRGKYSKRKRASANIAVLQPEKENS